MKKFFILCPPPNVTGNLHIGHALTFAIQNLLARAHAVKNEDSFLISGFDHGGISTLYVAKKIYDYPTFEQIWEIALSNKNNIKKQFESLKLLSKEELEGYTMDDFHYDLVQNAFIKFYNQGLIFRSKGIVNYDYKLQTVLSDLEVEMREENGKLYTLPYLLENGENILVCTSRPETIFADTALCVNPLDERYKHLIGKKAKIPIYGKWIPIISNHDVEIKFGSGVLKITPAHSPIDFKIGQLNNLDIINIIDDNGNITFKELDHITDEMKQYENLNCHIVREMIGKNYSSINISQQIPYGEKSKYPIEYVVKEQWFFNTKNGADMALEKDLHIEPESWINNYKSWLKNIDLWCISRQIPWGHKIPAWYKDNKVKVCIKSPGDDWIQDTDVLDTWFSSSLWPMRYKKEHNLYPCDVLVTGNDILFFWVARMVIVSLLYDGTMPFKSVLIHGLVRDERGRKMSKTLNNVINPIDIMDTYGGYDTLSLGLIFQVVPNGTICFGKESLHRAKTVITKLKNAVEFYIKKHSSTENICNHDIFENCCNHDICFTRFENDIAKHFYFLLKQQETLYNTYLEKLQIHLMLDSVLTFFYNVCDFLIEFSKHIIGLSYVLKQCLNGCIRMLYGFIPEISENVWNKLNKYPMTSYTNSFNYAFQPNIENLILLICKLRSFITFKISIYYANEYCDLICKMCNIQKSNEFNCTLFGYKIFIENTHLINDAIFKLDRKLTEINEFFEKCDISKIPSNILNEKNKQKESLLKEKQELEKLINS